jgi:hypothetical protein
MLFFHVQPAIKGCGCLPWKGWTPFVQAKYLSVFIPATGLHTARSSNRLDIHERSSLLEGQVQAAV